MTSDGGLLLVRELDERLGLTGLIQPASAGPHWAEYTVSLGGSVPPVRLHPAGGVRGFERWGPAVGGPHLSPDWLGEGLGAGCSSDLHPAGVWFCAKMKLKSEIPVDGLIGRKKAKIAAGCRMTCVVLPLNFCLLS